MCRWLLSLVVFASLNAGAQESVNSYSKKKEAALGATLSAQVREQSAIVESAVVRQYVERIGNKLTAVLPDNGITYSFTVIDGNSGGSTHEPLALPGGPIFVPATLMFEARNEAELASMLAHAIAHIAARHGTRLATRAQVDDLEFLPVMYLSPSSRKSNDERLRDLQQRFEIEADRMTVGIMAGAGYDPESFASYITRQQRDGPAQWSPLPTRDERVTKIRSAIQELPQNELQRNAG